ncbi:HU family DNA-binding protein [Reichenbachiella agarivorans]|uniref:HU family DNA-binding protein n=1 Tax=Reichenbachiella agarivorans TaxID=2979464 RepID=A0ABY6CNS7_9BACT|nr:HU family DNA-binding protein [Reichenbachiella agarivorans]UXP32142.1 HU family DNA-binding protein [Reichenbachiella agarivorans]
MAIKYKVVSKRPGGIAGKRPTRYYPVLTRRRVADTRYLINHISSMSTLSGADLVSVFESLRTIIPELLGDGKNVRIDGLGTFSIHAHSKGKDTADDVTSRDIDSLKISFLPDKGVKMMLKSIKFEKVQ